MNNPLIILAGGMSSRMKQSSSKLLDSDQLMSAESDSKGLIKLKNRPFLDYLLSNAKQAGFNDIIFLISQFSDQIKTVYKDQFNNLKLHYATQSIRDGFSKPAGTADALEQVLEQFPTLRNSFFTVCNSDNLYSVNVLKKLYNSDHQLSISFDRDSLKFDQSRISKFAILEIDSDNNLKQIIEKPSIDQIEKFRLKDGSVRISMNIFKFDGSRIYSFLQKCPVSERGEKELPSAIQLMLNNSNQKMKLILVSEPVPDLTQKDDILRVEKELENYQFKFK